MGVDTASNASSAPTPEKDPLHLVRPGYPHVSSVPGSVSSRRNILPDHPAAHPLLGFASADQRCATNSGNDVAGAARSARRLFTRPFLRPPAFLPLSDPHFSPK